MSSSGGRASTCRAPRGRGCGRGSGWRSGRGGAACGGARERRGRALGTATAEIALRFRMTWSPRHAVCLAAMILKSCNGHREQPDVGKIRFNVYCDCITMTINILQTKRKFYFIA